MSLETSDPSARLPAARARSSLGTLLAGAVISGIAFWLIGRSVNLDQTLGALRASHPLWFLLGFAIQLAAMCLSVRRWQTLLQPLPTRLWDLSLIYFSGHTLNTLLPAKLGTVARVALAAEAEHLNGGYVLGSVALEKVLDTLVMLVLIVLLAPFVPLPDWLRGSLSASVIVVLLGLGALVTVGRLHEGLLNIVARGERWLWGKDSSRLTGLVQGVLASVANLARRREALAVLVWTALVWFAGAAVNQLLFQATGIHVPWSTTWFLIVVLQIGTRVPALPANIGVFHYLVILALGVYGIDQSAALAYGILLHLIVFILPALIGAICMLPLSARLAQLVASGLPMLIHAKR